MQIKITNFEYYPGSKWDCGLLEFTAETDLGLVEYKEVVPGHRHSDDHAEQTLKLNGKDLAEALPDLVLPDFEPPRREGRWSALFHEKGRELVTEELKAWLEDVRDFLS